MRPNEESEVACSSCGLTMSDSRALALIHGGQWQLVPKDLPEEMRREGFAASSGKLGARALWRAMLAAAPKPEQE